MSKRNLKTAYKSLKKYFLQFLQILPFEFSHRNHDWENDPDK
jgi:hypothetical protein